MLGTARVALAAGLLATSTPALAEGAVAIGKTRALNQVGIVSYNLPTKQRAREEALKGCSNQSTSCVITEHFRNICIASAHTVMGQVVVDYGPTLESARRNAAQKCLSLSVLGCKMGQALCDTVAEPLHAPNAAGSPLHERAPLQPTPGQEVAIAYLRRLLLIAVFAAPLSAIYGYIAAIGRIGVTDAGTKPELRLAALGALSGPALVGAYGLAYGELVVAVFDFFEYSLEWLKEEFSILFLLLVLPFGLLFIGAILLLFLWSIAGSAFTVIGGIALFPAFIQGVSILSTRSAVSQDRKSPGWDGRREEQGGIGACSNIRISDAYEILGLRPGATPQEINKRYRELIARYHPDRQGSEDKAKLLNQARDVLVK